MKIAIPTNNGITLCHDFDKCKGFLILTFELGEIISGEMRWTNLKDLISSSEGFLTPISDCQVVMADNITTNLKNLIKGQLKEIVLTHDSIITNAYVHYLENTLRKESNTCCCP